MRDKLKDITHFENVINNFTEMLNVRYNKLDKGLIKPERFKAVKQSMVLHFLYVIKAKYCAGYDMKSGFLLNDYEKTVNLFYESSLDKGAKLLSYRKGKKILVLNQYVLSEHFNVIDILSLGILLDVPLKNYQLMSSVLDKDSVKDSVFEFLLSSKLEERCLTIEENFQAFSWYKDRFIRIKSIIKENDNDVAQNELKFFLEKEWYRSLHDTSTYNQHNVKGGRYVGYWCFLAAAIVKIKGLDDSSFRDNKYYPKDLL